MGVSVGSSPITVYELGRMVIAGDSQTHQIVICTDGPPTIVPGGMTTVNTASATPGQFVYAALPIPIVLEANTSYVFLSKETIGGDHFYNHEYGGASVTTTADAVLSAAALGDAVPPAHINYFGSTNQAFGPLDFKYAVGGIAGRPRTLVGTPYGYHSSTYRFRSSLSVDVMTGTGTVAGSWNTVPPGTLTYKWAVYGPTGNPMFSPIFYSRLGLGHR